MDTMLQHARMFGYREKLMPFTRVYLPVQLAVRFHEIHCIESRLRRQLVTADLERPVAIEKAANLKVTRSSVLDPTYIDVFEGQEQVYPTHPDFSMSQAKYEDIRKRIQKLVGGQLSMEPQEVRIDYDELLALIDDFPYNMKGESSSWQPGVLRRVIESQRAMDGPVFCAFRDDGQGIRGVPANPFWYPTLVLDKNMPSIVVNVTPDEP